MSSQRINICGIHIDRLSFAETVDSIIEHASSISPVPGYVVTPNAQHVVLYQEDIHLREIYQGAHLVVPDGVPLLWAATLLGTPLKGRVNGTDLITEICRKAALSQLKVFFLGGRPSAAEETGKILRSYYTNLDIAGSCCPPYGFENDPAQIREVNSCIREAKPHILFVALGSPKQEYWLFENAHEIGVPISIGIGSGLDFISNQVKRAPNWMQKAGLEWAFRLFSEPRRLWKRYLIGNPLFLWCVLKQRLDLSSFR